MFQGCQRAPGVSSLDSILKSGKIKVLTRNNANCYYLYRGEHLGFEHDMAKAFAEHLGVDLEIQVAPKWQDMIPSVLRGECAFVAAGMTATPARARQVAFSDGYMTTSQHIVVHRKNRRIQNAEDLAGRTVHVRRGTSYHERLLELQSQGIDLDLALYDDVPTEEFVRMTAEKEIEVTVADLHIARLNRRYYPSIFISGAIGEERQVAWALHPQAKRLLKEMNSFFEIIRKNGKYKEIYERYYSGTDKFDFVDLRQFHRRLKSRLPKYRRLIEKYASAHGFDWRWIAAQIYQESHFDPQAKSPAGAKGLMQLTTSTAKDLGVRNRSDPRSSIRAGIAYLKTLYDCFDEAQGRDRLFLAMASYNVGKAHVFDARKIAVEMGLDPNKWDSVKKALPLLRFSSYYQRANYGYCRGTEPVRYIERIKLYFDILKRGSIRYVRPESSPLPVAVSAFSQEQESVEPGTGLTEAPRTD